MTRFVRCIALLLLLGGLAGIAQAQELPLSDQVRDLTHHADEGIDAADHNRPELMRGEYAEIHAIWESFEDQVRAQDAAGYADIEGALAAIKQAVDTQPPNPAAVKSAYQLLEHEATEVADRLSGATPATASPSPSTVSLPDALKQLADADAAFARGDAQAAAELVTSFTRAWPAVEGAVATKSRAATKSAGWASSAARTLPISPSTAA
jgi:hypothetical protein